MKKKYAAIMLGLALSLSSCLVYAADTSTQESETTQQAGSEAAPESNNMVMGTVTAIDDTSVTVETMAGGQGGAPGGQTSDGQAPDGQAPNGQAPNGQAPNGQAPNGQAPADGQASDSQASSGSEENTAASEDGSAASEDAQQSTEAESLTIDDIKVGDMVMLQLNDDGEVISIQTDSKSSLPAADGSGSASAGTGTGTEVSSESTDSSTDSASGSEEKTYSFADGVTVSSRAQGGPNSMGQNPAAESESSSEQ